MAKSCGGDNHYHYNGDDDSIHSGSSSDDVTDGYASRTWE